MHLPRTQHPHRPGLSRASAFIVPLTLVPLLLATPACGPMVFDDGQAPGPACAGKCDGLASTFKDLFSDMKKVDLGDLVQQGAALSTDQLNKQLSQLPYLDIALTPTELYATSAQAKQDLTLNDIDELTAGLASRYGDKAFVTRINKLRAAHLAANPKAVFAEARFNIAGKLNPSFSFDAGGIPGNVGLLASKGIQATVIAPYEGELKSVLNGPVEAVRTARGFVLPRDVDDVEKMAQGETITLSSNGVVGINVGLGLPIYITTIESFATLHAVISAAGRATLSGKLDVQLVRGEGDEAIVDIGVTGSSNRFFKLAAKTAWGIEGLAHFKVKVGSLDLDVAGMAEKALEDLLNSKLNASAAYIKNKESVRHTVARFAFDLSGRDKQQDQALIQALMGDLRLAQALAQRKDSGVTQQLDLTRDARSLSSYLGLHFLSMRFFSQKKQNNGSAVITVGPSSQQLLFDELQKQSGSFWHTEGYRRRTVVSLQSRNGKLEDADVNLQIQIREQNKHATASLALGHTDPLLALFLGKQRVTEKLEPKIRLLRSYVRNKCTEPYDEQDWQAKQAYDKCRKALLSDPEVDTRRTAIKAAFTKLVSEGIQGGLDSKFDDAEAFAKAIFALKLDIATDVERLIGDGETGTSSVVVDYRLTEKAISDLLGAADVSDQILDAIHDTLAQYDSEYEGPLGPEPKDTWNSWQDDEAPPVPRKEVLREIIKKLGPEIDKRARRYQRYLNLGVTSYSSKVMGQTTLGNAAHLLVVNGKDDYGLATVAQGKAVQATKLFDKLVDKIKWIPDFFQTGHQVIGYSLLNCVHPSQTELLVNFDFSNGLPHNDVRLYGRGASAKLIDAGQYSLDALIGE
jgi:hypothetical protein